MRVTGGEARGIPLIAPRGLATRPTTDRVREALFSILAAAGQPLERVLDLYAGSGALAIEALSRGALWADLVEQAAPAGAAIRRNLAKTHLAERAALHGVSVARALPRLAGSAYSLILIDPPYADPVEPVLLALAEHRLLGPETLVVLEHTARRPPPATVGVLALADSRRYGDTGVAFYRLPTAAPETTPGAS
jgi:16S rRNA (guanine966-N2)-methyltransferase